MHPCGSLLLEPALCRSDFSRDAFLRDCDRASRLKSLLQRQGRASPTPALRFCARSLPCFRTSARRSALLFRVPVAVRRAGGGSARRGARTMRARSLRHMDVPSTNPAARSRRRRAGCPQTGLLRCVLLFGFFLLDKQEKETGPQGCGTKTHGCESVVAKEALHALKKKRRASGNPSQRVIVQRPPATIRSPFRRIP